MVTGRRFWSWVQGLVVLVALAESGYGLEASQVFTAVNNQGRPLVGASVSVVDSVAAPVTACSNAACTTNITQIPATGLFQFWADPGTYVVTISGSGVSRVYTQVIPSAATTGAITDADFPGNYDSLMRRTAAVGVYGQIRINTVAAIAPTANDDVTFNYTPGSLWVDTVADTVYINADATDGAAVWRLIGSANITNGSVAGQMTYWDGTTWTPTSWYGASANTAWVGDAGDLLTTSSTFQVGKVALPPTLDIYSVIPNVLTNTIFARIRFGSTDSSATPREAAFIKTRGLSAWSTGATSAPTSMDFNVQTGDGSTIGDNIFRIQPLLVIAGEDIPDNSLQGSARLVAQGVSITDTGATTSSVFLADAGQDVPTKQYTLPDDSGTAGYYMRTDGNAVFPGLSWAPIAAAPGNFAVTGQTTTTAGLVSAPSYAFISDVDTGLSNIGGTPCLIDEGVSGLCVNGNLANTFISSNPLAITAGVTANDALSIVSIGGSGNDIEVNANEFILLNGEVTFSGISGDTDGRALCKKADDNIGTCTDAPNGSGVCTCA